MTSYQHTVSFSLRHPRGSQAEGDFLSSTRALADIPGVERFEQLRQVSPLSDFDFALSMHFADESAFQAYQEHPTHVDFVHNRWGEVTDFQELDFVALHS